MAEDSGSWMPRIPSSICVGSNDRSWTERPLEESSHSERASYWLWHKREDISWKPGGEGAYTNIRSRSVASEPARLSSMKALVRGSFSECATAMNISNS
ncbi:hypothetical protein QQF64_009502 [Cirrhinus molitorella]|uniref:Uncharacterized protein n=1 Tax=Cirrhinus molitorella TaxID=172907 RepID=A0ABR3M2V6_9TELE